tara:strand:- start:41 stop:217 length:177 start_codon:yes stop_codon:yes gene_type:complete
MNYEDEYYDDPVYVVSSHENPAFEHQFDLYEDALDFIAESDVVYDDLYIFTEEFEVTE